MHKRTVLANTAVQFLGKGFSILINLLIVHYLARHYGLTQYGEYSTVFAYLLFFNIFADLGLSTILVRDIHEYTDEKKPVFIGNLILIRILSLIISLSIGIGISFLIPQYDSAIHIGILIGSASTFFLLLATLLFSVFQVHLNMQNTVYANALGLVSNLILVLVFIKYNLSVDYAVLALTIGYGVMLAMAAVLTFRLQKISFTFDKTIWLVVLPQSITIGGAIMTSSIYFKADSVILSLMKPYSAVSIYSIPYKILEVLISFPQMFMAPVFAIISKEIKKGDTEKLKKQIQKSVDFLLLAGLPIIPGALFLSQKIIFLYVGSRYALSVDLLKVLSIAVFLSFVGSALIFIVLALKKQRYLVFWNIFLSVFNVSLNILLIPHYTYYASAWLTVATEFLVLAGSLYLIWKFLHFTPNFRIGIPGIGATLVFTAILYFLSNVNLFLQAGTALILYCTALILFKAITVTDIKEVLHR